MTDVHADIHALSGAYCLDAVTDLERAAFDRHLSGCETCALEVAELRETAARLADGAWSAPPPGLRDNVLAQVRQTRQVGPGRPGRVERTVAARWRRRTAFAVAAAVLAAGAGAAGLVLQDQRVRQERQVAAAARAEVARMTGVLTASDAALSSQPGPGGAGRVTLAYSAERNAAVSILTDLPPQGPDRTYQLWLIEGAAAESMGVLAVGDTEDRRLIEGVRGASAFGVTVEPAGGSATPTGTPVIIEL